MSVSKGNKKLGKVSNISLIPGVDCKNCNSCISKCYAKKFYAMYPSVKLSWDQNSYLAKCDPVTYFGMVESHLDKVKPKYFRWHVGGDIPNQRYLSNMKSIADRYPDTQFLCFTKMFQLNYKKLPKNLKIFFSLWPGMKMPKVPSNVAFAWTQDGTENRHAANVHECPGSCPGCMLCWEGVDVLFYIHR
jgi:ferredoxin